MPVRWMIEGQKACVRAEAALKSSSRIKSTESRVYKVE